MSDLISREAAIGAASEWWHEMKDPTQSGPVAAALRALTPADATAALERIIADRVQAALAAQGEPVAWMSRHLSGAINQCSQDYSPTETDAPEHREWSPAFPVYSHPAPARAGVNVKALEALEELANIGVNCSLEQWDRISGAILAALSQPAQDK